LLKKLKKSGAEHGFSLKITVVGLSTIDAPWMMTSTVPR
jgi:hypothetical protein